jgi:putative acetyltransferase
VDGLCEAAPVQVRVRAERPEDAEAIRVVNLAAFETRAEADLVDALRQQASPLVSLVAERAGDTEEATGGAGPAIVGHILFTPVTLLPHPALSIMGLAPMAVLPAHQRQGVGAALIREGLERCRALRADAVVVLGHADYYPRFGFEPAARFRIGCEYDVPPEVFLALELTPGILRERAGTIRYHPAFAGI